MQKKQFVLSPCGTSLLTNESAPDERKLVNKYANVRNFSDIPETEAESIYELEERVRSKLKHADIEMSAKMSAELNGIMKLYGGVFNARKDHHVLLCTDTWLGEMTANLAAEWLRGKGLAVEIRREKDLQTADIIAFQLALSEIVIWCDQVIKEWRKANYHIVFNLTGGFKSVQGFLQTLATFYADETVYVFETAKDLLRIPRLPVKMAEEQTVRQHLPFFRKLSLSLLVSDYSGISEILIMEIDKNIALSPWGELVWKQTKDSIYKDEIYDSPTSKIRYGQDFMRSVKNLSPDRFIQVNEKIDQLAKCLETSGKFNPLSLDFKQLKGNPKPPSTYEMDAWHDQDAKRIFGHYEDGIFVIDKLDKALH